MTCRNVREVMTVAPNLTWHSSIFRTKHINCVLRVHEARQRRASSPDFHAYGGSLQDIQRPLLVPPRHFVVSLHALLARQAREQCKPDSVSRPEWLFDTKA